MTGDNKDASARSALQSKRELSSPTAKSNKLEAALEELRQARLALEEEQQRNAAQLTELTALKESLAMEKRKVKRMWREKCEQLLMYEDEQDTKDAEIQTLKAELARSQEHSSEGSRALVCRPLEVTPSDSGTLVRRFEYETSERPSSSRVGKAPPIDTFTGESADFHGKIGCHYLKRLLIEMDRRNRKSYSK